MIYEMRVYRCLPNRLPALLRRFEEHTLGFFKQHGIRQAGFFTTVIGNSNTELTYFLAWDSMAEREEKWTRFQNDAGWHKARAESEKDGAIVADIITQFLAPTAFSALK